MPFGGSRHLRLTRLPRHDRGPVPGGNQSAASCLRTVLRRALYHFATRSPSLLAALRGMRTYLQAFGQVRLYTQVGDLAIHIGNSENLTVMITRLLRISMQKAYQVQTWRLLFRLDDYPGLAHWSLSSRDFFSRTPAPFWTHMTGVVN